MQGEIMPQKLSIIAACLRQFCLCAGWVAVTAGVSASANASNDTRPGIVGEIITSIGEGRVISGETQPVVAVRGTPVRAGDRIETAIGGHVHIRFVDGGLVSVRPLSRLLIEAYRNADSQELAAIKFRLEEGVMRSMTGAWGEANRERYRLNTPVAAIGIKGTDYVVKAGLGNTQASVLTGAIIMAPLEGACAQALGPCAGDNSVLLTADMPGLMLELQRQNGSTTPRLVPAVDLLAASRSAGAKLASSESAKVAGITERLPMSNSVVTGGTEDDASHAVSASRAVDIATTGIPLQASKPLVWLHNVFGWNVADNAISQRFEEALVAGRTAVVGNFFTTLYRDETVVGTFQPIGSTATFDLKQASATYTQPIGYNRPVESVAISGATLNVDFAQSAFTTRMNLASPSLGNAAFTDSGAISKNGIFTGQQPGQHLAGAFSTDGREAGFQFSKIFSGGNVEGLTLWGR
jgi:hypothetical protein